MKPRIVILGPQGAGKGTQAVRLARLLHIPHVSAGDMLRQEKTQGTAIGQRISATMNAGRLIDDRDTNAVMRHHLGKFRQGWISDGYPRRLGQAKQFQKFGRPNLIIVLSITDKAAIVRLAGRRVCARGHIYHIRHDQPKKRRGYCDHDGLRLKQRSDDTPRAIRRRLSIYHHDTEPMIQWYHHRLPIVTIDAHQSIKSVYRDVLTHLKKFTWLSLPTKRN